MQKTALFILADIPSVCCALFFFCLIDFFNCTSPCFVFICITERLHLVVQLLLCREATASYPSERKLFVALLCSEALFNVSDGELCVCSHMYRPLRNTYTLTLDHLVFWFPSYFCRVFLPTLLPFPCLTRNISLGLLHVWEQVCVWKTSCRIHQKDDRRLCLPISCRWCWWYKMTGSACRSPKP